jgi:hypothetical protein
MSLKKYDDATREYRLRGNSTIVTTRFNEKTFTENRLYCDSMNMKCIYTASHPVAVNIPLEKEIFVLEMNNETNQIMGIGRIFNIPIYNKHKIHVEQKFNVFSYVGKSRIDRTEMHDLEEDVMKVFDVLCFKGKRNLKRLKGIKRFPIDMLYKCKDILDIVKFISEMFVKRINKHIEV